MSASYVGTVITVIPVPTPIIKATSDTDSRYSMSSAAVFMPMEGPAVLAATDGRRAAIVPVGVDTTDRGPDIDAIRQLPRPALKACKWRKGKPGPQIHLMGSVCTVNTDTEPHATEYPVESSRGFHFPPLADVLPKPDQIEGGMVLSFNPFYLWELAQAVGADGQVTVIADPNGKRPMVVMPNGPDGAIGVLMPCSGAETADTRNAAKARAIKATESARSILNKATARRDSAQPHAAAVRATCRKLNEASAQRA